MKVLRIIARLNVGGPARHVIWLTDGLTKRGYETKLVAGTVPAGEDDMSYVASAAGVTPLIIPEMSRELSPKDLLTMWKLFRLMRRERPDIVHTHTAKAGAVGRAAGLLYRWLTSSAECRFVHTYHGHIFHGYYGRTKTRVFLTIERLLARFATDRIVVLSQQQLDEINGAFRVGRREQFSVIPLGIEVEKFANWPERRPIVRRELKATEGEILVGIVGRLTEVKNHRLFLGAAARYKKNAPNGPPVRFIVIGDGGLRGDLEATTRSLGLSGDVVFLGSRNDPENFYPALDIVTLTSVNEGTPLTLIEGMANARPVIATEVGGVVDLVGRPLKQVAEGVALCERGISVKSRDGESLARGFQYLIQQPSVRNELGARGREFVVRQHAKERLLEDVASLYRQLLSETQTSSSSEHRVSSSSVSER